MTLQEKYERIRQLKKEKDAIILAHYYQVPEIQDIADFLGDSLALAQRAQKVKESVIVFCGVHFMAETAKILNPEKTVVIPDMEAGCSLAASAPKDKFKAWVDSHPNSVVISYVNCTADVKALSDIICTSSNAEDIVASVPEDKQILFAPDRYLGGYIMKKTGRNMILWDGTCEVHEVFSENEMINLTAQYPDAYVLAHPECPENILDYADYVGSTAKMIQTAKDRPEKTFIVATESGILHEMQKQAPGKQFIPVPSLSGCACNECPYMKMNTIDKLIKALETLEPEIHMDEETRKRAELPLTRMLEISAKLKEKVSA